MHSPVSPLLIAALAWLVIVSPLRAQALFQWLSPLPADTNTSAAGISADGSTVVGHSWGSGNHAASWQEAGPAQALGILDPGNTLNMAEAASADGSVIVGYANSYAAGNATSQTFRWTAATGMVSLGDAPGNVLQNQALGVSADGTMIVGQYRGPETPATEYDAFTWTEATGFTTLPSLMPQYMHFNRAMDISADGSVIVGSCGYGGACRWTAAEGVQPLFGLDTGGLDYASAVSADGQFITGRAQGEAFLWQEGGAVQWLGVPPDKVWSWANGVSGDGRVVVGGSEAEGYPLEAIIWTADDGLRYVREMLETDYGLSIPPEALREATGISDDGRVITGDGALGAWVLTIPEPSGLVLLALGAGVILRRRKQAVGSGQSDRRRILRSESGTA